MSIKFENTVINNSQVGGKGNIYYKGSEDKLQWDKLEKLLNEAISKSSPSSKEYTLAKCAKEHVQKRDRDSLKTIVTRNVGEFTKNIFYGLATNEISELLESILH